MSWRSLLYLLKWYRTFYLVEVGEGTGGVEKNAVWEGGGGGGGGERKRQNKNRTNEPDENKNLHAEKLYQKSVNGNY